MNPSSSHEDISDIMEAIATHVQCDQLINMLADKHILTTDDVSNLNRCEEMDKIQELTVILLGKDQEVHPLALKILETYKEPSQENKLAVDSSVERLASGDSQAVSRRGQDRRILSSTEVSGDWELKNFLFDLSKELNEGDLQDMKDLMNGESGFKKAALEKITRPMQFFQQLMNTSRLNAYNLHFLQALVRRAGRLDLNDKVRQFCRESHKKPIHFFTPSDTPENGYKYVKFHVSGDVEKLTHTEKERLRVDVAALLCVPPMVVFVAGIEPTASLMFTFMVPEEDVSSFIHLYVKEDHAELAMCIQVAGNNLELSDGPPAEEDQEGGDHRVLDHLKDLLRREQGLQKQLEERDERLHVLQEALDNKQEETTLEQMIDGDEECDMDDTRDLRRQVEFYKSFHHRMIDFLTSMQLPKHINGTSGSVETLKLTSASSMFRQLLQQVRQACGDGNMGIVNKLLDVRVVIENTTQGERFKEMQSMLDILAKRVNELTEEIGVLKVVNVIGGGSSTFLQDMLAVQAHRRDRAIEQQDTDQGNSLEIRGIFGIEVTERVYRDPTKINVDPEFQQKLSDMTASLSNKDRARLKTFLCLSESELEELKRDQMKLLEVSLLRELHKGRQEPPEVILEEILAKIKKKQLVRKFLGSGSHESNRVTARKSSEKRRSGHYGRSGTPQRGVSESSHNHVG